MTSDFTIFLSQVVREQKIPFEIGLRIPNSETIEAINEVTYIKENPTEYKVYKNVDNLFGDIIK